ncbi:transcription factor A, mitochondrial [Falco peregrinus]|uniref:transcription factor A, mitochondrial n=2 Tax=Falco TaxID=8952 RepID=UPI00247A4C05|nr:transcription factor A, mitochondrial [Falco peregrinus]
MAAAANPVASPRDGLRAAAAVPGCRAAAAPASRAQARQVGMAAALGWLGRAAALVGGAQRLLRCCGGGSAAAACLARGISSVERPKRPMSAYFRFLKEHHAAFRQKNPEASSMEVIKKIADAWKALPVSQKQAYEEARKTDWQKYQEQMASYKAQLTPAQAAALKEERRKRLAKRRSFKAKRELTVLGKPKRPRSGFNIFVSENFKESEGVSPVAKLKQLFDAWQKLSSTQKQPYLQLAEDDKVRYENEMRSWEAKMVELGREDLIRSKKPRPKKKTAETEEKTATAKASSHENKAKLQLKRSEE